MRKKFYVTLMTLTLGMGLMSYESENPTGKAGKAGGPMEGDCTDCHSSYALNSGTGSVAISSNIPNGEYTPGQSYAITVVVSHAGRSAFGLCFEALRSTGANAGTLTAGTGTHTLSATVAGNSRTCITQTTGGGTGTSGSHTFNFTWTAPATDVGNITFYCTGMAANSTNGNSNEANDYVYSTSQVITPFVAVIPGCMDQTACNYNAQATLNEDCVYAQQYYDCNGNCLVDVDNDGVCDQLEVLGCNDNTACNFNPAAGLNDGSCYFIGQTCDDGVGTTVNDMWDNSCVCAGLDTTNQCNGWLITPSVQAISCYGASTGSISLGVVGAPNYVVEWDNGMVGNTINNLPAGQYIATVSAGNCSETHVYNLYQGSPIVLSTVVTGVDCFGGNNGSIALSTAGGVEPYSYFDGSGNGVNPVIGGLSSGMYTYVVMDDDGCTDTTSVMLTDPAPVLVNIGGFLDVTNDAPYTYTTNAVNGASYNWEVVNGTVVSGQGTNAVVITWDATGATQAAGSITCAVTTDLGCTGSANSAITITNVGVDERFMDLNFFPNPGTEVLNVLNQTHATGQLVILDLQGKVVYQTKVQSGLREVSVAELPAGTYMIQWKNQDGSVRMYRWMKAKN